MLIKKITTTTTITTIDVTKLNKDRKGQVRTNFRSNKPEGEGGADGEAVSKVVDGVADDDHQAGAWHGAASASGGGNCLYRIRILKII